MNSTVMKKSLALGATALVCSLSFATSTANAASNYAGDCLIEPMIVAEVGSPVQGVIASLLADRSDFVEIGQPIALLNSDAEEANLAHAKSRAAMMSEIKAREADLALATHNHKRLQQLFKQQLVPAQERDEAVARQRVAEATLIQARESNALLQIELQRARQKLEQRTIRSSVAGVIVEQHAFPGEFVYDNPVMTVAQLDPLRVEVVLPARYFGMFEPGDTARIVPEIAQDEPLTAIVDVVDRLLDTRSGTFGVRLTLPNADLAIPGGQKCQIEFIDGLSNG